MYVDAIKEEEGRRREIIKEEEEQRNSAGGEMEAAPVAPSFVAASGCLSREGACQSASQWQLFLCCLGLHARNIHPII